MVFITNVKCYKAEYVKFVVSIRIVQMGYCILRFICAVEGEHIIIVPPKHVHDIGICITFFSERQNTYSMLYYRRKQRPRIGHY